MDGPSDIPCGVPHSCRAARGLECGAQQAVGISLGGSRLAHGDELAEVGAVPSYERSSVHEHHCPLGDRAVAWCGQDRTCTDIADDGVPEVVGAGSQELTAERSDRGAL